LTARPLTSSLMARGEAKGRRWWWKSKGRP
jgi:hypothetical protein